MGLESFAGTWLCTEVEKMTELLEALDVGFIARNAAYAFNYGKGSSIIEFQVDGDKITLINKGMRETTNNLTIGGSDQELTDPTGETILCDVSMEGDVLVFVQRKSDGSSYGTSKRFIRDGQLIVEISMGDVIAVRTHTRQ
eukprot:CAMPEP_0196587600 /NCGR_PEP_ID=MMETSP1081-20130531/58006_1 /TAXON_ID=36882 /ORGANISM="Pyramimonas amylifera, Strain CCMP720" /LENGTH=140 /DNA_ID=CAMNT_0041909825 /DNA_START=108 /DNA_END=530 /DNA_ORIENTATION=+